MTEIEDLLRRSGLIGPCGPCGPWAISRPAAGSSGRTFIARQGDSALIVKLDDRNPGRQRLADLGITPPLIATGTHRDAPFSVYELIAAGHPDPAWMTDHRGEIAALIRAYQDDQVLADTLGGRKTVTLAAHVDAVLGEIREGIRAASSPRLRDADLTRAIADLARDAAGWDTVPLVPAHTDPNTSNWLVATDRTWLIDWDGITLSDPLRDVGLVLWWYVPPLWWSEVLEAMGIARSGIDAATGRVF